MVTINTYIFKIRAIDEENYNPYTVHGILVASSFTEATDQIEQSFKDTLLTIENLTLKDEGNLIFLPPEVIDDYMNTDCPILDYSEEEKQDEQEISN